MKLKVAQFEYKNLVTTIFDHYPEDKGFKRISEWVEVEFKPIPRIVLAIDHSAYDYE